MAENDLALLPAAELARRVRARELSPVEVLDACLERVERLNGVLNAVVTLNPRVREEAEALERRLARGEDPGILAGLPVGIKDVTQVAGLRTTFGSPLFADHVPPEDALVVRRLRDAGAVVLGKTNCPEFAAGGNTFNEVFGRTRNPWDPERSAGGSTGGGACGLATGMIALAEGTDLGGSLRIPASFCGVVGIRPSVGLVPTVPSDYLWDTMQVTGPMGRTAEDVALALQAIAGPSDLSPLAQPVEGRDFVAAVRNADPKGLRLAYCPDIAGIGIDADVERVCREAVEALAAAGAEVETIELDLSYARKAFLALRGLWFVSMLYPHLDKLERFGVNVGNNLRAGLGTRVEELGAAEAARRRIWEELRALFGRFDHLLTPTMAVPPFPVVENYPRTVGGREMETYVDWIAPTFVLSMTGLPVASVPCGLDRDGMPVGMQVVGRPRGEEGALAVAAVVQRVREVGLPSPAPTGGESGE
ncbi:MAG TPA: amidase family protein [Longimicrobiaceae bacterium]|nr:amidase family protein [Longimicrobiaceae bacterium]